MKEIRCSEDFYSWYDSLSEDEQGKVDHLADIMDLPQFYDDCSDDELASLHDSYMTNVNGSYDPTVADLYVVKIWHDDGEELIKVVAGSPDEALERAKDQWTGPIEEIEVVDINPEDIDASADIKASSNKVEVKVVYAHGFSRALPELRTLTSKGKDLKEALIKALDHMDIDVEDLEDRDGQEILDDIMYYNENNGNYDFIFLLEVDGDAYIDNTAPEENY